MSGITRESHYVPQATLRRWSDDGVNVWAYRLLAPSENVDPWRPCAIRGLTKQRDLYTTFEGDKEGDDFEKFITREIEAPGQSAIEKVIGNLKMKPAELACYREVRRCAADANAVVLRRVGAPNQRGHAEHARVCSQRAWAKVGNADRG